MGWFKKKDKDDDDDSNSSSMPMPGHCEYCGSRLSEKGSCLNSDCPSYDDSNPINWD